MDFRLISSLAERQGRMIVDDFALAAWKPRNQLLAHRAGPRRWFAARFCSSPAILGALLAGMIHSPLHAQENRAPTGSRDASRPNVLFIAIDDLNHWVGHLGRNRQTITPHIDRLAARGVTFVHAYCAAPVCNPSRAALLSGLRPSTSGVYDNATDWRPFIDESLTLPSYLRRQGYYVAGAGKIYHGSFPRRSEWDDYFTRGSERENRPAGKVASSGGANGISWAQLEGGDAVMRDHHVVDWCIQQLERKQDRPFFLACGLVKPHLPWAVPKEYFAMHPLKEIELPPFREDDLEDVPGAGKRMALSQGDHAAVTGAGLWKQAIQAYLAAISFADAEVGRLVDALDRSPHRDNTIVVLWGDHGWHLGEKLHWRKFALWEEATRAPLIWVIPGLTRPGGVCQRTVDFMSIYPTLVECCGLPIPNHVEGQSIRRLLADPGAHWELPAVTTHGFQNHAVRSERWRYICYADGSEELYDHSQDPYEWSNSAGNPDLAEIKRELAARIPSNNKPAPAKREE